MKYTLPHKTIPCLFEIQAARIPDHIALEHLGETMTYAELEARADDYAHFIVEHGVEADGLVAVLLDRTPEWIATVLGIMKAGCACLPLDPYAPSARTASILEEAEPGLCFSTRPLAAQLCAASTATSIRIAPVPKRPPGAGAIRQRPSSIAYCIYTSGSSGRPKGVLVGHDGMECLSIAQAEHFGLTQEDRVAQFASPAFDASLFDLVMALAHGATLVIAPDDCRNSPHDYAKFLADAQISVTTLPTIMVAGLSELALPQLPRLRAVIAAGDALSRTVKENWRMPAALFNAYGPTEASIWSTIYRCRHQTLGATVPIGKPIRGTTISILSDTGEPVVGGETGEIHIGGVGLAHGYLRQPALTDERFIISRGQGRDRGTDAHTRLYRSGDLGRYLADGNIEFLGRIDHQVKIRGFRIELAEIEGAIRSTGLVRDAVVLVRGTDAADKSLEAFVISSEARELDKKELLDALALQLPRYMLPASITEVSRFPLNSSGKIDRHGLLALEKATPSPDDGHRSPMSEAERQIAAIWRTALRLKDVGRDDCFYSCGGHSIAAAQIASRINQVFDVLVSANDVLRDSSVSKLARLVESMHTGAAPQDTFFRPEKGEPDRWQPTSFAQMQVAYVNELQGSNAAYVANASLHFVGLLDIPALQKALQTIVDRHEIFRTRFETQDGRLMQQVDNTYRVELEVIDWRERTQSDEEALMRQMKCAVLDSEVLPLVAWKLLRIDADTHKLLHVEHHYVHDGWSYRLFLHELSVIYSSEVDRQYCGTLPEPTQFSTYCRWQNEWINSEAAKAQARSWRTLLHDASLDLHLPALGRREMPDACEHPVVHRMRIDAEKIAPVGATASRLGMTRFQLMFGLFAMLVSRLAGRSDLIIGSSVANRTRLEWEHVLGMVVNIIPIRIAASSDCTIPMFLNTAKQAILAATQIAELPFSKIAELVPFDGERFSHPIAQVFFSFHSALTPDVPFAGLKATVTEALANNTAKFPLNVTVIPQADGGNCDILFEFDPAIYAYESIVVFAGLYRHLLESTHALLEQGMGAVDELVAQSFPPLPDRLAASSHRSPEKPSPQWNLAETSFPSDFLLHGQLELQAELTPDVVAVTDETGQLTYAALNAEANRLAHYLIRRGVRADEPIAIVGERTISTIVGIMAILKSGAAYVPLDPTNPDDRLDVILRDSAPRHILGTHASGVRLTALLRKLGNEAAFLAIDGEYPPWASLPRHNPSPAAIGLAPNHLAYIIYTSGSTGTPKGVMVEHRNIGNLLTHWATRFGGLFAGRPFNASLWANFGFDAAVFELFAPLSVGGTVNIVPESVRIDPEALYDWCGAHHIAFAYLPPFFIRSMDEFLSSNAPVLCLKYLMVGAEPLNEAQLYRLQERCAGIHIEYAYGPTEASVFCTSYTAIGSIERTAPIGSPIANTQILLLDEQGAPVSVGAIGEIYICGAGVARGYLNRPDVNAQRFLHRRVGDDSTVRIYRSGDLARWLPDGMIEFVGRRDAQIKLRGFRIELGEIEAQLIEHAGVRDAAVAVYEDERAEKHLVAYYVPSNDTVGVEALRHHLHARLPEYMVPGLFVELAALPLTASGKLNRHVLPAPIRTVSAMQPVEKAADENVREVLAILRDLDPGATAGADLEFVSMGFYSLSLMRVAARIRKKFSIALGIVDVMRSKTPRALGLLISARLAALHATDQHLDDHRRSSNHETADGLPAITPVRRDILQPLSFAQQRLWLASKMRGASTAYHIPIAWNIEGPLDHAALKKSVESIVARHAVLRSRFTEVSGDAMQTIAPVSEHNLDWKSHNLRDKSPCEATLESLCAESAHAPFDLQYGPLIRVCLIRIMEQNHVLLVTMHHIVADGWSMPIFLDELSRFYAAYARQEDLALPSPALQYVDYACWQRQWQNLEHQRAHAQYWMRTLKNAPPFLALPADKPRPEYQDFSGEVISRALGVETASKLKSLGERHGATPFIFLFASWAAFLFRLTGQDDIIVGIPCANRQGGDIENMIGFFVNTLPVRVKLANTMTVGELIALVREQTFAAQEHQELPFEQIVELTNPTRSTAYNPLFQTMFDWQEDHASQARMPGLAITSFRPRHATSKFDLLLAVTEGSGDIGIRLEFATALFDRTTAERFLSQWVTLVQAMADAEHAELGQLPLLGRGEREEMLKMSCGATTNFQPQLCVHEVFEAQARRTPGAPAILHGEQSLTYGELDDLADRLAAHLSRNGVAVGSRVALLMQRSIAMVVGTLAVLKCGASYVPIDPVFPKERRRFILDNSKAACLLFDVRDSTLVDPGVRAIPIDIPALRASPVERVDCRFGSDATAYIMYTSGSTGVPKGVLISHRAINRLVVKSGYVDISRNDRVAFASNIAFDASTFELWMPLLNGACIVVADQDVLLDPNRFGEWILQEAISILWLTAGLFHQYALPLHQHFSKLRYLIAGGDVLDPAAVACVLRTPPQHLLNGYGPTETTTFAATHEIGSLAPRTFSIPLGRPIANTAIYILNSHSQLQPIGVAGELCIGGDGVAQGYLAQPELQSQRFIRDPFSEKPDAMMYRTGDIGRWNAEGVIEFLGRNDSQVKIRGYRIEPGEIEAHLSGHPGVLGAKVLARKQDDGTSSLVAYYVGQDVDALHAQQLHGYLAERLPGYMVPAAFVQIPSFPLTTNGKIDQGALPVPGEDAYARQKFEAPCTQQEVEMAELWRQMLKIEMIGRDDNFFALGGHSILAVRLLSRLHDAYQVKLTLQDVFEYATLAALSERVLNAQLELLNSEDLDKLLDAMAD